MKQAASTLYSMQKGGVSKEGIDVNDLFDDLKPLLKQDFRFLEKHYPPALELIPMRYRNFTSDILSTFAEAMTKEDIKELKKIDKSANFIFQVFMYYNFGMGFFTKPAWFVFSGMIKQGAKQIFKRSVEVSSC